MDWIFSLLGAEGRELFCLHACAVLHQKEPTSSGKDIALKVWERMPEDRRQVWAERTPQMLLEGTPGFEDLLATDVSTELAAELRDLADRACVEYSKAIDGEKKKTEKQARKEAQKLEKKASNMKERLQLLLTSAAHAEGKEDEDRLMNRFDSVDGQSIFCYHALRFVAQKLNLLATIARSKPQCKICGI